MSNNDTIRPCLIEVLKTCALDLRGPMSVEDLGR